MGCIQTNERGQSHRAGVWHTADLCVVSCVSACASPPAPWWHICVCVCAGSSRCLVCSGWQQMTLISDRGCGRFLQLLYESCVRDPSLQYSQEPAVTCVAHRQRWQWIFILSHFVTGSCNSFLRRKSPKSVFKADNWLILICIHALWYQSNALVREV